MKNTRIGVAVLLVGFFSLGLAGPVQAKKAGKKLPSRDKLLERLFERTKEYAELYENRKFKDIYDLINAKYKKRVSRAIYEDFITFPGATDKYFQVVVEMYDLLDDLTLGKVIFNISTYVRSPKKSNGSSGSSDELESEFLEVTDWIYENGDWYKYERYDK